jgi:hypothetical protein
MKSIDPKLTSNFLFGEKSAMLSKAATIACLVLIPLFVFAMPKEKETTTLQVVSSTTKIHGSSSNNIFIYTDLIFAEISGKRIVYECVQRGDICPMLEPGKSYTADRDGVFIYLPMVFPEDKKTISAKFREVGSW